MANIIFDYAVGRWVEKYRLPIGGDNILVVLLKLSGLQVDSTLNNYQFLSELLAANAEADFTNYGRKVLSSLDITVTPDTVTGITTVDLTDQIWTSAGGAVNNDLGAFVTCYRQTSTTPDSSVLLLTKHDYAQSTTGEDLKAIIPSIGTAKWVAS